MNILFLNNYYYLRGGSERVFFGEMELMKKNGHNVSAFSRKHPEDFTSLYSRFFPPDITTDKVRLSWEAIKTVKEMLYSGTAKQGLEMLLREVRPEIAHVHNMYGRLTTSVLDVLTENEIPVVMTLHDHKLICPTYRCMRNNRACEECAKGGYIKAVMNRCHKNSLAASAVVALESYYCRWFDKYGKNIRLFLSPSRFLGDKLIKYGWPESRIRIIPNFIHLPEFNPDYTLGRYFLYLGRLSEEKGIHTLIEAFKALDNKSTELLIVGDGPLRNELESLAGNDGRIRFAGYLSGDALQAVTRQAMALVIPSECYENAPLSVIEAMAYGKPVIGSMAGGIPEMVIEGKTGFLFQPGDIQGLKQTMKNFLSLDAYEKEALGKAARKSVEETYTEEAHYLKLMEIYQEILQ